MVLRLAGELRGHPHTELKLRGQGSPLGWGHTILTLGIPGTRRSWICSSMLDFWGVPELDDRFSGENHKITKSQKHENTKMNLSFCVFVFLCFCVLCVFCAKKIYLRERSREGYESSPAPLRRCDTASAMPTGATASAAEARRGRREGRDLRRRLSFRTASFVCRPPTHTRGGVRHRRAVPVSPIGINIITMKKT